MLKDFAKIPSVVKKLTIEARDIEDAAEKIYELLKNTKMREKLRKRIAKNIRENFSWKKTAEETVKVYKKCLNKIE